ncbi:MAG: hypothetical protein ACNI27_13420 [Desulfovibrio sp.]
MTKPLKFETETGAMLLLAALAILIFCFTGTDILCSAKHTTPQSGFHKELTTHTSGTHNDHLK